MKSKEKPPNSLESKNGGLWDFRIVLYDATGVEKNGGSGDISHISLGPAW